MPDPQQIIVEFIADTSQLTPSVDKLEAIGKIDQKSATIFKQTNDQLKQRNALLDNAKQNADSLTVSVSKEQQIYNKLVSSLKILSGASKEAVQNLLKLSPQEVSAGFDKAAVSVDDYIAVLEGAGEANDQTAKKMLTVRQELKAVTEQLALLTLNEQTSSKEFEELSLRAGKLRNALDDTRATVSNLGQDVPTLRVFSAGIESISSAFTLATGAQALFGNENKDLQEVLVRVNAVMAINAGIQQLLTTLSDEALVSTAKTLALQKIKVAQTAIENGLQSQSIIVRGGATVAQYALNFAMSLSPLGIVTIALAAFVAGMAIYISRATAAAKAQSELNGALSSAGDLLDAEFQGFDNANKKIIAGLEGRNARQSEIDAQNLAALKIRNAARLREIDHLNAVILKNQGSTNSDTIKLVGEAQQQLNKLESEGYDARTELIVQETAFKKQKLNEQLEDRINSVQAELTVSVKNSNNEFALRRQLAQVNAAKEISDAGDNADKILAIRSQLARELKDIDIAQAKVAQDQISALLNSALIKRQNESRKINDRESKDELDAQINIIKEQADFDVQQEGLKGPQKKLIRDKANQQILDLQREFNKQEIINALQDQISLNNAVLSKVKTSEKDKLDLRIQNIILASSIEIEQNKGKVDIIKGIEAKRDEDIRIARIQSIEDTLSHELRLQQAQQAGAERSIERILAAQDEINNAQGINGDKVIQKELNQQKISVRAQEALIDELTNFKLRNIQKEIDANDEEFAEGLISFRDFTEKSIELEDKAAQATEDAEERKTRARKKAADKAKEQNQEIIKIALQAVSDGIGILSQFYQQDSDRALARVEAQKQQVQDLADAGAITAKEASARNKKLDIEAKQLQIQQAKRQKELDLFQAIINTALAVTNALTTGDPFTAPIRAAIAGAIGLTQVALIANRPIPQFGKGKKNSYQGWGEIAETGPEILERNGRMYLQEKRSAVWLGAQDKVYSPIETMQMLETVPTNYYPSTVVNVPKQDKFDYDKMGKAVGRNMKQYGIGVDELGLYEYQKSNQSFTKYLGNRRSFLKKR